MTTKPKSPKPDVKSSKKNFKPSEVILTVENFVDVLKSEAAPGSRDTECKMTGAGEHPNLTITRVHGKTPEKLIVKRRGLTLCFRIESKDDDEAYFPLGIAFRRRLAAGPDNDKDDILGRKNFAFGTMHLFGRSLYITDNFHDCGKGDRYKFSVIIQRERDGAIGIIDPPIDHNPGIKIDG